MNYKGLTQAHAQGRLDQLNTSPASSRPTTLANGKYIIEQQLTP
jgi:hypothetical protein